VTLSVGATQPLPDLRALARALPAAARPDFFTAHYFMGGAEGAADLFRRLDAAAGATPLWIGEIGYPASTTVSGYAGVPLTPSAQEAAQTHFLRLGFAATRRLGLADPGIWVLDDFALGAIPESDVSPREPEYAFGLFRVNGSAKPAAATVKRLFAGGRDTSFNGGFEQSVRAADGTAVPAIWSVLDQRDLLVDHDRHVARTGAASVRLSPRRGTSGSGVLAVAPVDGAIRPGRVAEATAWTRAGARAGTVRLRIDWFDERLKRIGARQARARTARSWARVAVVSRAPAGAVFARIAVAAEGLSGTLWVDDVAFSWR